MVPLEPSVRGERDGVRSALLLGLAAALLTLGVNWPLTPGTMSATPVFVASVIAGFLAGARSIDGTRAGAVTGVVGGAPIVGWQSWVAFAEWWRHPTVVDAVGDSWAMGAASVAAGLITVGFLIGALLLTGLIGGFVGEWLNGRVATGRARGTES